MATAGQVLSYLCGDKEWSLIGENYEDINWLSGKAAITKAEFETGFDEYDAWKTQKEADAIAKRQAALAKLEALGLDIDDLKALGLA